MGRSSVQLFQGFPQEDRVTLHHEHRHALVSGLRCLGDGVVIIALHPDNPCATGRHGADPGRTNMGVHKETAAWAPTSYAPAAAERPWSPSVAQAQVIAAAAHLTSGLWISCGPLRRMRWRLPGRARSHIRGGDLGAV